MKTKNYNISLIIDPILTKLEIITITTETTTTTITTTITTTTTMTIFLGSDSIELNLVCPSFQLQI